MFRSLLIALLLLVPTTLSAQRDTETVTIPKSALTTTQREQINAQLLDSKIAAYGKWVGVGHEIGEAVNSSLMAVTDNASKFADTRVGKTAVYLVVWKVVGRDILGLIVAAALLLIGIPIWVWSYRNALRNRYPLEKETFDDKGKVTSREYKMTFKDEYGKRDEVQTNDIERVMHWITIILLFIVAIIVAM